MDGRQTRVYRSEWTKSDAQNALAAFLLKIEQPKLAPAMTLAEASDRYLATKARKRTLKTDERILAQLKSFFGADAALSSLTASRIDEYRAMRLATRIGKAPAEHLLTAAAINRPLALLRHLLRIAHDEWEALPAVPKIRLEKEPQGRLRWLTEEEIKKLLEACQRSRNSKLRPAVVIAIHTGLRRSELLDLTWDRIDLSRGVIRLELTKNGKRREVPLNEESYAELVSLGPQESGRLFEYESVRKAYENAVRSAKLDDVNFHTLRHTFASWAVMRGVSLKELQELLVMGLSP
jgi:integrase